MTTTGDQQLVKRINRSVLLRLMRAQPGLSRAQLASHSGLTKSTVSLLVRELIEEGWAQEDMAASVASPGRPSTPLRINAGVLGLVGVEVAVDCLRVVGVSLLGQVLWSIQEPLASTEPAHVCARTAALVTQAHTELALLGLQLSGVGVGLPGAFEDATGVVRFAPNLGWKHVDFLSLITHAFLNAGLPAVPVYVQNEADSAALSEYEFTEGVSEGTLIFVNCDVGVGAGIVLNDRLFTGAHGMAGEIGHSIMQIDGPLCSCGRRGCAETFIGARALLPGAGCTDPIQRAGSFLGVLLQNLWTTFDSRVLVAGGPTCVRYPELVQVAQDTLQTYAAHAGMAAPVVRGARYGLLAPAVGAAALVVHQYLRPMHLRDHHTSGAGSATQPPSVQLV
jgi:predicted NBD/HSP70 family sugar kinase/DNA-binding XRE family transcriptional regulator